MVSTSSSLYLGTNPFSNGPRVFKKRNDVSLN